MYLLSTVVASLAVFFFLKWMKKRRYCTDVKRLDGKTVLITGASSGVGKETAVALAARGARVVVACRDAGKAEKAVREIKLRSRSLAVVGMELDLASLRSVRRFCENFLRREERLDVLINNAAMPGVLDWTEDGFSMCLGVNHLGHFLLTNLLLGRLKECAPSRVVTLTCSSYKYQKLDLHDLNYNLLPFFTYCRSKLANVYFSHELGRLARGKGVTSFAVHPGLVRSEWTRHYSLLFRAAMRVLAWMLSASCEAGAQTVVYCAVSDEAARLGGGYFVDCRPATLRPFARDAGVAKKLWEASERLVQPP
ncbi:retinol dehydrogenase 14 isoform X2 [Hippocampus comes]|uniref:Si:dkey-174n20.1 n=1 Tax=Hippocampus comes TaxID=109280 RepID=A0A3Q3DH11_HIPCM|nr:PREDICTED: retinol dehydrogenase 14-like isoform X2 [Hippocampus comes]